MAIKRKLVECIKKGDFRKIDNDNYILESKDFGRMKITIYKDWVHTQFENTVKAHKLLRAWDGDYHTGKCNFMEKSENIRLQAFKGYLSDYNSEFSKGNRVYNTL